MGHGLQSLPTLWIHVSPESELGVRGIPDALRGIQILIIQESETVVKPIGYLMELLALKTCGSTQKLVLGGHHWDMIHWHNLPLRKERGVTIHTRTLIHRADCKMSAPVIPILLFISTRPVCEMGDCDRESCNATVC